MIKYEIKKVQRVVGTFLYYGRAVDNTILPALNDISASQASPTKNTMDKICKYLKFSRKDTKENTNCMYENLIRE